MMVMVGVFTRYGHFFLWGGIVKITVLIPPLVIPACEALNRGGKTMSPESRLRIRHYVIGSRTQRKVAQPGFRRGRSGYSNCVPRRNDEWGGVRGRW